MPFINEAIAKALGIKYKCILEWKLKPWKSMERDNKGFPLPAPKLIAGQNLSAFTVGEKS